MVCNHNNLFAVAYECRQVCKLRKVLGGRARRVAGGGGRMNERPPRRSQSCVDQRAATRPRGLVRGGASRRRSQGKAYRLWIRRIVYANTLLFVSTIRRLGTMIFKTHPNLSSEWKQFFAWEVIVFPRQTRKIPGKARNLTNDRLWRHHVRCARRDLTWSQKVRAIKQGDVLRAYTFPAAGEDDHGCVPNCFLFRLEQNKASQRDPLRASTPDRRVSGSIVITGELIDEVLTRVKHPFRASKGRQVKV
ncbi:hypothetical protein EVAR_53375_1 [Eumeta japonica]|uniref:Uncharacterized protein n=1 Tax=Eumeta variegata TaxID=151549 RepID=A0A4C1Y9H3_EUMVA|nr:hypothetical protein EVAR_53375_1 [Eumeta japonica]